MDSKDTFSSGKVYVIFALFLLVFGAIYWEMFRATKPEPRVITPSVTDL